MKNVLHMLSFLKIHGKLFYKERVLTGVICISCWLTVPHL